MTMYETIDINTFCPVCGFENKEYKEGKTDKRYCGCVEREEAYLELKEREEKRKKCIIRTFRICNKQ